MSTTIDQFYEFLFQSLWLSCIQKIDFSGLVNFWEIQNLPFFNLERGFQGACLVVSRSEIPPYVYTSYKLKWSSGIFRYLAWLLWIIWNSENFFSNTSSGNNWSVEYLPLKLPGSFHLLRGVDSIYTSMQAVPQLLSCIIIFSIFLPVWYQKNCKCGENVGPKKLKVAWI